jgi:chaperonin GroES
VVDGEKVPMEVKVGDKVIYQKFSGSEVKLGDDEYIVIKQDGILAVVE